MLNMSSLAGTAVLPGMAGRSTTTAAMNRFTAGLRAELLGPPVGITVVETGSCRPR